jgi:hypothetical protein
MRPTEVFNLLNKKSFLYISFLTTKINPITGRFILNPKNVKIKKNSQITLKMTS